jgi:hypothetical protein
VDICFICFGPKGDYKGHLLTHLTIRCGMCGRI